MQFGYETAEIHHQFIDDDVSYQNHHFPRPQHSQQPQQQKQKHVFQNHFPISPQIVHNPQHFQHFEQQQVQIMEHHNLYGGEVVGDADTATVPLFTVNFKLGLNENSGIKKKVLNEKEEHGHGQHFPEIMPNCWQTQEDSVIIREPFWKPLNAELKSNTQTQVHIGNRHFTELEAIYNGHTHLREVNQIVSESALMGEKSPTNSSLPTPNEESHLFNITANCAPMGLIGVDHGSEASIGKEASLRKRTQNKKIKRKMKDLSSSMALFFERLVGKLMDHQEGLHRKFLAAIEKMDLERINREESRRQEENLKFNNEAIARAHEKALASSRETAIVSCLEKITGQCIKFPNEPMKKLPTMEANNNGDSTKYTNNRRWPKAEVEALICVRCGLESKFQEPGIKGHVWEDISNSMASMGYSRSAKRCKEKWENINKYFKKTKKGSKKRCRQSYNSCSYFDQLDELYSRSSLVNGSSSSNLNCYKPSVSGNAGVQMGCNSELLEAMIVGKDGCGDGLNPSFDSTKVAEMVHLKLEDSEEEDGDDDFDDHGVSEEE